jgi:hypothetical protein
LSYVAGAGYFDTTSAAFSSRLRTTFGGFAVAPLGGQLGLSHFVREVSVMCTVWEAKNAHQGVPIGEFVWMLDIKNSCMSTLHAVNAVNCRFY